MEAADSEYRGALASANELLPSTVDADALLDLLSPGDVLFVPIPSSDEKARALLLTPGILYGFTLPLDRSSYIALVDKVVQGMQSEGSTEWQSPLWTLSKMVLPAAVDLGPASRFIFVYRDWIVGTPINCLQIGNPSEASWLIRQYRCVCLSTIGGLVKRQREPLRQFSTLLVLSRDADLRSTKEHASALSELFEHTAVCNGDDQDLVRRLQSSSVAHLMLHGINNGGSTFLSVDDAGHQVALTVEEILKAKARCDLVTLSACQTERRNRDTIGLAEAFVLGGADAAVGTLWNVVESATLRFMVEIYDRFGEHDIEDVFQRACKGISSDAEYSSPLHWAGFLLFENGVVQ